MTRRLVLAILTMVLVLAPTRARAAKNGCTIDGGNTLCCNCPGQGSCESAGCEWSGGLNGECGLKGGKKEYRTATSHADYQKLVNEEYRSATFQLDTAAADVRKAEQALNAAKQRLAAAQRASRAAKRAFDASVSAGTAPVTRSNSN